MECLPETRRRFLLKTAALALVSPARCLWGAESGKTAASQSPGELAHTEIWRRFVDRRFDVLLHYAGRDGEVIFPSGDECREAKPNGMGWSSPIEDGPFFGGLFLDGLCNRWRARRDEESATSARRIAAGLMKLADWSPEPGFVPRGIGADGQSFYPASSEDQVFPWIYGLWSYLRTELPGTAERAWMEAKLLETVRAIESHGWQVPCAPAAFGYRGNFTRPTAHDAARLLFLLRLMHQFTGEERWLKESRERLQEIPAKSSLTRREILANGLDFDAPPGGTSRLWTHSMSQAALRALSEGETDPEIRGVFRDGLLHSAHHALPHLERSGGYVRTNTLRFDGNWRFLNASWKPQANCEEAIALGRAQLPLWAETNPRSPWEDDTVREPLFAAWMIMLAGDAGLNRSHGKMIEDMLARYDWTGLYTAGFFIAVNIQYESYRTPGF